MVVRTFPKSSANNNNNKNYTHIYVYISAVKSWLIASKIKVFVYIIYVHVLFIFIMYIYTHRLSVRLCLPLPLFPCPYMVLPVSQSLLVQSVSAVCLDYVPGVSSYVSLYIVCSAPCYLWIIVNVMCQTCLDVLPRVPVSPPFVIH